MKRFSSISLTGKTGVNVILSGAFRGGASLLSLLNVILLYQAYSAPLYGFFAALQAYVGFLFCVDLGIPNAMQNIAAEYIANKKNVNISRYIYHSFVICLLLGFLLMVFSYFFISCFPRLFSSHQLPIDIQGRTFFLSYLFIVSCGLLSSIFFAGPILMGLQDTWLTSVLQASVAAGNLLIAFAAWKWALGFSVFLFLFICNNWIFAGIQLGYALKRSHFTFSACGPFSLTFGLSLIQRSWPYCPLNFCGILLYVSPTLLVAYFLDFTQVGIYSVLVKFLFGPFILIQNGLQPLWPAYTLAAHTGQVEWICKTFRLSLLATGIYIGLMLCGVMGWIFYGPNPFPLLTHAYFSELILLFALWSMGIILTMPQSVFLNAFERIRLPLLTSALPALLANGLLCWLLPIFGIIVVPLTFLVTFVPLSNGMGYWMVNQTLKELKKAVNTPDS